MLFFLILNENLVGPLRGPSNEYPQHVFIKK